MADTRALDSHGERSAKPSRKIRPRDVGAIVIGALVAAFAVLNLDEVEVNWLLGTWQTPLILVIAVAFLLGVGFDRALVSTQRRRRRKAER